MSSSTAIQFNTITEAIEDIKNGKVIIVVDDEDRENEGDFVAAADLITPEIINFMSIQGRGLVCTPLTEERCEELDLHLMVTKNTDPKNTAFTVSIDLVGEGVTTGISASDRALTIQALMNPETKPEQLARPGHIFPLIAKKGGVLKRAGHTEAAVDIVKLAGLKPGGVITEIMNEDGTMARVPELMKIADKFNLKIITIKDLISYRLEFDSLIEPMERMPLKTIYGHFDLTVFKEKHNEQLHFALTKGNWEKDEKVLVRVQSSNTYYDIFSSLINGEKPLLKNILEAINQKEKGAFIMINNVSQHEVVEQKLYQFKQFIEGKTEKLKLPMDSKDLGIGAQIIKSLGISNIELLTRSPKANMHLSGFGLEIVDFQLLEE